MFANVLMVEGKDDLYVLSNLFEHRGTAENFRIKALDGIESLFDALPVQIKGSGIDRVGIVVDADFDLPARWQRIRALLAATGYQAVPELPNAEGTNVDQPGLPSIGIWIMPDNVLPGMLEDFVRLLIPAGDQLTDYADRAIRSVPEEMRRYKSQHTAKAFIHTWLAWQSEPGSPLGLAITQRHLDAGAAEANAFVHWIEDFFGV